MKNKAFTLLELLVVIDGHVKMHDWYDIDWVNSDQSKSVWMQPAP